MVSLISVDTNNALHQRIGTGLGSQRYCRAAFESNLFIKIRIAPEHPIVTRP
ncbi:hypothetical protein T11_14544 [Trichinella zimbabwensis]|uniref:Uncharacterized protein n=1 Tax=Trichinella zimbabwensis TaxID=268475 RepID=A0A0V1GFG6_9BILA|nr:hypothetical protein T11_8510 [Trichinella zimbabwensis]KRY99809.1 hypothetical protein T11_14544 [Trichinella zimbabwensis]